MTTARLTKDLARLLDSQLNQGAARHTSTSRYQTAGFRPTEMNPSSLRRPTSALPPSASPCLVMRGLFASCEGFSASCEGFFSASHDFSASHEGLKCIA